MIVIDSFRVFTFRRRCRAQTGWLQEMIGSARCAARVALPRTTSADGVCAVATNARFVCTALSIARAGAGFRLHLADLVAILVRLAGVAREIECCTA